MANERAGADKYDRVAGSYSSRYADPDAIASRQVELVTGWGAKLAAGGSVLELGCADGFVTERLVRAGLDVTAVDFSPGMIDVAQARLSGTDARLAIADLNVYEPERDFDVVMGLMWTFFGYVDDPVTVLARLGARTRRKLLVDVNPRAYPLRVALRDMHAAGFSKVSWRPFFVPQTIRTGPLSRRALRAAERVPGLRGALLTRKFVVVIKGER